MNALVGLKGIAASILVGGTIVVAGYLYLHGCVLMGHPAQSRRAITRGDMRALDSSLVVYRSRTLQLPSTEQGLSALVEFPTIDPLPKNWGRQLKKVPIDPWGHAYHYRYPGIHNKDSYDLFSAGPDGVPGTDDDIGNW